MEIFHVENNGRKILSIFHPANHNKVKKTGVIICSPLGHEYLRFYKAISVLAKELSSAGFATFRFDYYGAGDSHGDETELDLSSSKTDLRLMIKEMKEGCGVDTVCLIGVRYGSLVSLASLDLVLLNALILWNPIFSGKEYLSDIIVQEKECLSGSFAVLKNKDLFECMGFLYSTNLVLQLEKFHIESLPIPVVENILILADRNVIDRNNLNYKIFNGNNLQVIENSTERFWIKQKDERAKSIVPMLEIKKIVEWIENLEKR